MRFRLLVGLVVLYGFASAAMAGITVSSIDAQSQANAYAPLDKSQYFATDDKPNISPATADVSVDWTGANVGGTDPTWRWVASADTSSATTTTGDSLTMTGAGSFNYDLTTTAAFVDPTSVTTLYAPHAGSELSCTFAVNAAAHYSLRAVLNRLSGVFFASVTTGNTIFLSTNLGTEPDFATAEGNIPPGQYSIAASANFGPPNLPPGINHSLDGGNFSDFLFTVQVPEPVSAGTYMVTMGLIAFLPRRRT